MACAFKEALTLPSPKRLCTNKDPFISMCEDVQDVIRRCIEDEVGRWIDECCRRMTIGFYEIPSCITEVPAKQAKAKCTHRENLEEVKEIHVSEEMYVLKELNSLGTSSLILVFDCLKGLESTISKVYKEQLSNLPSGVHAKFGQIVKDFQKRQKDGMVNKTTGATETVCKKIGIITFSAALYDFVSHYNQYKMNEKDTFTEDDARTLAKPLLHLYQNIMKRFVGQFQVEDNSLKELEGGFNTLQEWHALYMLRIKRDHHGGHCASWRNGYPDEGNRLRRVKAIFEKLMHCQSPELRHFSMLQRLVVPNLESYIVEKEARVERVADPMVDGGAFEKFDCEWLQDWI